MRKLSVKRGDTVLVIAGKDKDKRAKVLAVSPETGRVLVEGVAVVSKCKKARSAQEKSTIVKRESAIDASNVMVVCPKCGKATRVAHAIIDGKKARICKKCGASLDAEFVKDVKKADKKAKEEPAKPAKEEKAKKAPAKKAPAKKAPAKSAEKKTAKKSTKAEK